MRTENRFNSDSKGAWKRLFLRTRNFPVFRQQRENLAKNTTSKNINKAAKTEPINTNIMKTIFFLSCLLFFDGVKGDVKVAVGVTDGREISLNSNATNSVPLYVNTKDSFFITAESSLVKFLPRALLITKRTPTEPQIMS